MDQERSHSVDLSKEMKNLNREIAKKFFLIKKVNNLLISENLI